MLINTGEHITEPQTNTVVFYQPWVNEGDRKKKPFPVIINDGCYLSGGRISNFWYWQRLSPTGRINPNVEHGYGNFTIAKGYEVQRKVRVIKEIGVQS